MRRVLNSFVVAGVAMAAIDAVWLGWIANSFYKSQLGPLLLDTPNMAAAAVFYIVYVIGIVAFAVVPALRNSDWRHATGYGALLGFVAYATYDLTNLATLQGFTLNLVIVDLLWGTLLTASVATITYFVVSKLPVK